MRRKKKIIFLVSGLLLVIGFLVWYYYPALVFRLGRHFIGGLNRYLDMAPLPIGTLKSPPQEWITLDIGSLTIKLPRLRYEKVGDYDGTNIYFVSDAGPTFLVSDIVPSQNMTESAPQVGKMKLPLHSYQERLEIFNSSPADISIFHSRNKNMRAVINLTCKALGVPLGGTAKLLAVNTGTLKALCVLSERKVKNGYVATARVYSPNEAVRFSLILRGYEDQGALEADLLTILGGIRMPDHMLDRNEVSKDITSIVNNWERTRRVQK